MRKSGGMLRQKVFWIGLGLGALALIAGTMAMSHLSAHKMRQNLLELDRLIPPPSQTSDPVQFHRGFRPKPWWTEQPVHVHIGGKDLWITSNYFDGLPPPRPEQHPGGFLLRVGLPDFNYLTEDNYEQHMFGPVWDTEEMLISVTDQSRIGVPVDEYLAWLVARHINDIMITPGKAEIAGLEPAEIGDDKASATHDLYVARNKDGGLTALIRCYLPRPDRNPSCGHQFIFYGASVRMTYHRDRLENWAIFQGKMQSLLEQALIPPATLSSTEDHDKETRQ